MDKIILYTDGACSGNPGPGGWGCVLISENGEYNEISGFEDNTTNNRMELTALIRGLEFLKDPHYVEIYSDSAYIINCFTNNWIDSWQKKNWRNAKGEQVKNIDLWQRILELIAIHKVTWIKVKGHTDNEYNNRCDTLATTEIKNNRN